MRTITVTEFISLDGVIQGPGGPDEDPSGGFGLGGWTFPFHDVEIGAHVGALYTAGVEMLLGRTTYDIWAGYWPFTGDDMGRLLTATTKHVASTTLTDPSWDGTVVLSGDTASEVAALKATEGPDLLVAGSSVLVRSLLAADLVDRLDLLTFPVVLGAGKRLFDETSAPHRLRPTTSTVTPTGVVVATYEKAGAVEVGSFADGA